MREKIIALFLTAIMAVMVFTPVIAQTYTLGDYPNPFCVDGDCTNFRIVYGSQAKAEDLAGGSDVIARLSGESYTLVSTTGDSQTTVTGEGARLDTSSNRILISEYLDNARSALTSVQLPTLLASGTVTDDSGNEYDYTEDIYLGGSTTSGAQVTFGNSDGDLDDPELLIEMPSSSATTSSYMYKTRITFSKLLNISDSDVQDNKITLFGNEYTIGSTSDYTASTKKLVLYGGAEVQVINEGEEVTVTIGGTEYTVGVSGVSATTSGVITVNGESRSVTRGNTYKISGLEVYVSDVYFYPKEGQISQMKLSLGSEKITLEEGQEVLFGTSDYVENTYVDLSGTAGSGLSKVEIYVSAQDSDEDHISVGSSYTDPVWKTFKLEFSSTTPALDSADHDTIEVAPSGDRAATVKFTDYYSNEKTIEFTYNNVSSLSSAPTIYLMDSNSKHIHVKEGEAIYDDEYVVINQGDETHLLQLQDLPYNPVRTTDKVRFKDVFTEDLYEKTVDTTACGTYCNITMTIGSQDYYIAAYNQSTKAASYIKITWDDTNAYSSDTGATYGVAGNYTLFPGIKANNGEYIYLVNNYTTVTCNDRVNLPKTGDTVTNFLVNCTLSGAGVYTWTPSGSQFSYNLRNSTTTAYITMANLNTSRTGIAILEEKQADGTTQDVVYIPITTTTSGSTYKTKVNTPTASDTSAFSLVTLSSNTYLQEAYDVYGTKVHYDSYEQGKATITYPDDQIYTDIFLLTEEAVTTTTTTEAGAVKQAVPITWSVSLVDTDIQDPATVDYNLILVGGSCANSLVQQLVDNEKLDAKYTCTPSLGEGWETGKGYIWLIEDAFKTGQTVLVVAGTEKEQTKTASSVLQKFDTLLKDSTATAIEITSATTAGITPL